MSRKQAGQKIASTRERLAAARAAREVPAPTMSDAEGLAAIRDCKAWLDDLRARGYQVDGTPEAKLIDEAAAEFAS